MMPAIAFPSIFTDWSSMHLTGEGILHAKRTVADLAGYWHDDQAALSCADRPLYETFAWYPVPDGTEGAVLWGSTILHPGTVGGEFHMTRGHWHLKPTHGELVITVSGTGLLVLMNADREVRTERMTPGSTHYIDGSLAHRTVNDSTEPLTFWCTWPADCGHEYQSILAEGFAERFFSAPR